MKLLGRGPEAGPSRRPASAINAVRDAVQQVATTPASAQLEAAAEAGADALDVTEPGVRPDVGRLHVLLRTADELVDLFARMGFDVAAGPEVEDDFHNFVALNIPESHPARDPLDNFYLADGPAGRGSGRARCGCCGPRRAPCRCGSCATATPPIRVIIPGRVYRPDTHDDTHLSMFHQLEALVVDEGVTMADLKSTVTQFVRAYFGRGRADALPGELLPVHRAQRRGRRLLRGPRPVDRARRVRDGPPERAVGPAGSTPTW